MSHGTLLQSKLRFHMMQTAHVDQPRNETKGEDLKSKYRNLKLKPEKSLCQCAHVPTLKEAIRKKAVGRRVFPFRCWGLADSSIRHVAFRQVTRIESIICTDEEAYDHGGSNVDIRSRGSTICPYIRFCVAVHTQSEGKDTRTAFHHLVPSHIAMPI
jgi:hypothetical protein